MQHSEWIARADHLLNTLEQLDYKSEPYRACRAALKAHLAVTVENDQARDFEDTEALDHTLASPH